MLISYCFHIKSTSSFCISYNKFQKFGIATLSLLLLFLQPCFTQKVRSYTTFTDQRDKQTYKTVTFNKDLGMGVRKSQTWLAENLRFEVKDNSWWYDNNEKTDRKYGRLYTWEAAKIACPEGWRLPTDLDWQILIHQVTKGGRAVNAEALYQILLEGGDSGFAALLGGYRNSSGEFDGLSKYGYYWSATEQDADSAWFYIFDSGAGEVDRSYDSKAFGLSCRCLKD